jgi:hypothetical protein
MDEVYFLRHILSSIKYRCSKAIRNAPDNYLCMSLVMGLEPRLKY